MVKYLANKFLAWVSQRGPSWSSRESVKLWIGVLGSVPFFTPMNDMTVKRSVVFPMLLSPPSPTHCLGRLQTLCINVCPLYLTHRPWHGEGDTLVGVYSWVTSITQKQATLLPPEWINPTRKSLWKTVLSICQEPEVYRLVQWDIPCFLNPEREVLPICLS